MADGSEVASYSLRVKITPRLAERLQALAVELSTSERQLGAVALALGFSILSMRAAGGASPGLLDDVLASMAASCHQIGSKQAVTAVDGSSFLHI